MANGDVADEPFTLQSGTGADSNTAETEDPPKDPTTNQPSDSSNSLVGLSPDELHKEQEYQQQLENQYKSDTARYEQNFMAQQKYIENIQQQMRDLNSTPMPQMMNRLPPPTQEDKTKATQNLLQLVAIAGIAFSVFGSRRNPYAQGALMGGMGALLQGYATASAEKQKNNLVNWHQLNEGIQKENQDRRKEYEGILANKKLNLAEQMKLMEMKGQFYGSPRMMQNALKQDLAAIHTHLIQMRKAEAAHAANTIKPTEDERRYAKLVDDRSQGAPDRPANVLTPQGGLTNEGYEWALKNYPYSQYLKEKETKITTDEEGNVKSITRPGFTGKESTAPKGSLDEAMDKTYGKKKGGIDPKAKSSTTTEKKSALDNSASSGADPDTGL